jgi:hypothetical protein
MSNFGFHCALGRTLIPTIPGKMNPMTDEVVPPNSPKTTEMLGATMARINAKDVMPNVNPT